ncbi:LysM peptidoglycan-binding domain-containing protein [Bacillus manliponensis]|uniref:LysM peptidoglycan-binding domain-containing protein n=1 Tax=Bacillus manliponensis TaxID=574376 RepID=UPI0035193455
MVTIVMRQAVQFEEHEEKEPAAEGLPPRSEVHKDKKKKFRIKHFFVRVLTVLFILLPISMLWYTEEYIWKKSGKKEDDFAKSAFEEIFFDSKDGVENVKEPGQPGEFQFHTVKEGETLESIGKVYFPNEDGAKIIKKYNELQWDELEQGQVLKIPKRTGS